MNRVDKLFNVAWVDISKKFNRDEGGAGQKSTRGSSIH